MSCNEFTIEPVTKLVIALALFSLPLHAGPLHIVTRPPVLAARETYRTGSDIVHFRRDPYWATMALAVIGAYTADIITTKMAEDRNPSSIEVGPIFKGTHATWNLALGWGAIDGAALVFSHRLNRTHTLWGTAIAASAGFIASSHAQAAYSNAGQPGMVAENNTIFGGKH